MSNTALDFNSLYLSQLNAASSTGYISGLVVTINSGDATRFDISEGWYQVVDNEVPSQPVARKVYYPGITGVLATEIANAGNSFILLDKDQNIIQYPGTDGFPTGERIRNQVLVGALTHLAGTVIEDISETSLTATNQIGKSLDDLMLAIGAINVGGGNEFSGSPNNNLKFQKSAGSMTFMGISNKRDYKDPNRSMLPAVIEPVIFFNWRDGSGGFNFAASDAITTGVYDDGTGGVSQPSGVISTNQWINCFIQLSPDEFTSGVQPTVITYGRRFYNSDTSALAFIAADLNLLRQDIAFDAVPIVGCLTIRGGAINTADPGDAVFTQANRFGEF